jgi:hypothetical protein
MDGGEQHLMQGAAPDAGVRQVEGEAGVPGGFVVQAEVA